VGKAFFRRRTVEDKHRDHTPHALERFAPRHAQIQVYP
jgi:hypothetical protein